MALASGLRNWTALIPRIGGTLGTHRPNRRTVASAQRASVDPTEASDGRVARVGRIDRSNFGSIDFGVVGPERARGSFLPTALPLVVDQAELPGPVPGARLLQARMDARRT